MNYIKLFILISLKDMIFKPLRQLSNFYITLVIASVLMLFPLLVNSKTLQNYSFEKSDLTLKADSFLTIEFYDDAIYYYQKALAKYQSSSNWEGMAYTYNQLGFINIAEFNLKEGKIYLDKSGVIINKNISDENQLVADYCMFLGIYFNRSSQKDSALFYHDKGIEIKRRLYGKASLTLAESYRFKAQYLIDFESLPLSEKLYREAINMYEEFLPVDHFILGKVYSSLSSVLKKEFDYDNAVMYAEKSVEILENAIPGNPNTLVIALIILANAHNEFDKFHLSTQYYDRALELIENNINVNQRYLSYIYLALVINYARNDNPEKAFEFLRKYEKTFLTNEELSLSDSAYLNDLYGLVYMSDKKYQLAKYYTKKALSQYRSLYGSENSNISPVFETLGSIYERTEEYDSSLYSYQMALISLLEGFNEENIYSNPSEVNNPNAFRQYDILYKKASLLKQRYFKTKDIKDLNAALKTYILIDKLNDYSRNSRMADASLLVLNEYFSAEYEKGIDCAYLLYQKTKSINYLDTAFILMEKSKYMLLFKSLSLAEKTQSINLPVNLKFIEDSLKSQYTNFQIIARNEENKEEKNIELINELNDNVFIYRKALDELKTRIQEEFPSYAQIKYDSLFKTFDDFKNYCEENDCIGIEYYWGEKAIYIAYADSNDQSIIKIERTAEFDSTLLEVLHLLKKGIDFSNTKKDFIDYVRSSNFIYNYLLKEVVEQVDNKRDLLIIPDGLLSQLPFEALVTKETELDYVDYQILPYLLKSHMTGYAYSANLLLNESKKATDQKNRLLAFSYSSIEMSSESTERSMNYIELPNTELELNAIQKEIGRKRSQYYYNFDATENRFKSNAANYHIIHLAVHGETDTTSAINSRLIFKDSLDTKEDGRLYIHELYELNLSNVELAVLSACETGIGKEYKGEGVFSMARGFAYAGCPSIVMSLWRVKDKHTAKLMAHFYNHLNKGEDIVESLNLSKQEFLAVSDELTSHPSNWAAFIPVGKNPVLIKRSNMLMYFLIFLAGFAIILFYYRFKRKNQ